jgi:hypothetical protein
LKNLYATISGWGWECANGEDASFGSGPCTLLDAPKAEHRADMIGIKPATFSAGEVQGAGGGSKEEVKNSRNTENSSPGLSALLAVLPLHTAFDNFTALAAALEEQWRGEDVVNAMHACLGSSFAPRQALVCAECVGPGCSSQQDSRARQYLEHYAAEALQDQTRRSGQSYLVSSIDIESCTVGNMAVNVTAYEHHRDCQKDIEGIRLALAYIWLAFGTIVVIGSCMHLAWWKCLGPRYAARAAARPARAADGRPSRRRLWWSWTMAFIARHRPKAQAASFLFDMIVDVYTVIVAIRMPDDFVVWAYMLAAIFGAYLFSWMLAIPGLLLLPEMDSRRFLASCLITIGCLPIALCFLIQCWVMVFLDVFMLMQLLGLKRFVPKSLSGPLVPYTSIRMVAEGILEAVPSALYATAVINHQLTAEGKYQVLTIALFMLSLLSSMTRIITEVAVLAARTRQLNSWFFMAAVVSFCEEISRAASQAPVLPVAAVAEKEHMAGAVPSHSSSLSYTYGAPAPLEAAGGGAEVPQEMPWQEVLELREINRLREERRRVGKLPIGDEVSTAAAAAEAIAGVGRGHQQPRLQLSLGFRLARLRSITKTLLRGSGERQPGASDPPGVLPQPGLTSKALGREASGQQHGGAVAAACVSPDAAAATPAHGDDQVDMVASQPPCTVGPMDRSPCAEPLAATSKSHNITEEIPGGPPVAAAATQATAALQASTAASSVTESATAAAAGSCATAAAAVVVVDKLGSCLCTFCSAGRDNPTAGAAAGAGSVVKGVRQQSASGVPPSGSVRCCRGVRPFHLYVWWWTALVGLFTVYITTMICTEGQSPFRWQTYHNGEGTSIASTLEVLGQALGGKRPC